MCYISRKIPAAEWPVEDSFIDDRNFLRSNDVMQTAINVFTIGLDGATTMSPMVGG